MLPQEFHAILAATIATHRNTSLVLGSLAGVRAAETVVRWDCHWDRHTPRSQSSAWAAPPVPPHTIGHHRHGACWEAALAGLHIGRGEESGREEGIWGGGGGLGKRVWERRDHKGGDKGEREAQGRH